LELAQPLKQVSGLYYDIDLGEKAFSSDDFKAIEDKMIELARLKNEYQRKEVSKADAIAYFTLKPMPLLISLPKVMSTN